MTTRMNKNSIWRNDATLPEGIDVQRSQRESHSIALRRAVPYSIMNTPKKYRTAANCFQHMQTHRILCLAWRPISFFQNRMFHFSCVRHSSSYERATYSWLRKLFIENTAVVGWIKKLHDPQYVSGRIARFVWFTVLFRLSFSCFPFCARKVRKFLFRFRNYAPMMIIGAAKQPMENAISSYRCS